MTRLGGAAGSRLADSLAHRVRHLHSSTPIPTEPRNYGTFTPMEPSLLKLDSRPALPPGFVHAAPVRIIFYTSITAGNLGTTLTSLSREHLHE